MFSRHPVPDIGTSQVNSFFKLCIVQNRLLTQPVTFAINTGGVPPMREDGYGVFYGIENDRLHFSLFEYKLNEQTDGRLFFNEICNALRDIEKITQKAKL